MERQKSVRRSSGPRLKAALASAIDWWEKHGRNFPWRNTRDPFRILVAELLLQRSRSGSVREVYIDLFERWPTPTDLKEADTDSILAVIEPLGLQHRAVRIKKLASAWDDLDRVPTDVARLQELPGIGPYSAKATAVAMSWTAQPPVDSVSSRVMKRLLGDLSQGKDDDNVAISVYSHAPEERWRDLNWAILDIAAAVCMPKVPRCNNCPLSADCGWSNY
jgi:A/G-specific adenine glycosylase